MDEAKLVQGQKVSFTDNQGHVYVGVVEHSKRGWVMVDLDKNVDTGDGWAGNKMMLKSVNCNPVQ